MTDEVEPLLNFDRAFGLASVRLRNELTAAGIDESNFIDACRVVLKDFFGQMKTVRTNGPCKIIVKKEVEGREPQFRHAACIGGEAVRFKDCYIGAKQGIIIQMELELPRHSKDGSGWADAEFSSKKMLENLEVDYGTGIGVEPLRSAMRVRLSDKDLFNQAENIKHFQEENARKKKAKEIVEKKEHYGRRYGSWG